MFSRFSRRQVLSIASFTIAGTAVAVGIPFFNNFFAPKAQAQEISEEIYKGRIYRIIKSKTNTINAVDNIFDTSTQLFIDSNEIKVLQHNQTKKYTSPILFGQYDSPEKIAKTIIDLGLKFPDTEINLDPNVD